MITAKATVDDFLAHEPWAVVGVSRDPKKFGHTAYKELKARGRRLLPVNPGIETFEGDRCWPSLRALPEPVGGALIIVPPAQTEKVVQDALAAGIRRVWMQQGAESEAAIRFCQANGISEVHGECIMMHAPDTAFFHKMHRWVWGMLGKLPK
jgi:predicted CoA-binding protein